jgi:HD-like signal output (HDOD) protein
MTKSILFVDDEKQILRALKRLFIRSDYETYYAESGEMALQILEDHAIDLLITDIRMPIMDGYELLRKVKEMYPLTLRVALSGYTDNIKIYKALEDNIVKLYLFKPWNNDELKTVIDKIFEQESILKDKNLLRLINNINDLPTVPNLYQEIAVLIESGADIDEISTKIEKDPAISSRILRVANSAFYGTKTGSIKQAIIYIGLTSVKNIVLTNSVFKELKTGKEEKEMLWKHASLTNAYANIIYSEFINKKMPSTFASAGLLHDIGKVVIYEHFSDEKNAARAKVKDSDDMDTWEAEKEVLGVSHQEIGGYLLNWWELPFPIVEATLFHHNPTGENIINKELVSVIHLANYYSWKKLGHECLKNKLVEDVFEYLEIDKNELENFIEHFEIKI